jgi:hypothetical protein
MALRSLGGDLGNGAGARIDSGPGMGSAREETGASALPRRRRLAIALAVGVASALFSGYSFQTAKETRIAWALVWPS